MLKPDWLRVKAPQQERIGNVADLLVDLKLNTVCQEASCPNIGECFAGGTATFLIMGPACTRKCPYCDISFDNSKRQLDPSEPDRLGEAVYRMGLTHVVITSVNRDDLEDGGASQFLKCIEAVKSKSPFTSIEVLIPDLCGNWDALKIILDASPNVLNHNIETVKRLYKHRQNTGTEKKRAVRPQANYERSLKLLKYFSLNSSIVTKSGIMIGLSEEKDEVIECINDLSNSGCKIINIGQYLQPTPEHINVSKYYSLEEFENFKFYAENYTTIKIADCGPMVRSSYRAEKQLLQLKEKEDSAI